MSVIFSKCVDCKHFTGTREHPHVCKAFPDGIPDDVYWGKVSHDKPVDGDHGIQFELIEKKQPG